LKVPRRDESRVRVPAGAVALAAGYTGIYPRASPGGWQLIGSTAAPLWDVDRDPPALLRPGVRVRFHNADAGHRSSAGLG
jgi:allophanate hydrolase subunit 1